MFRVRVIVRVWAGGRSFQVSPHDAASYAIQYLLHLSEQHVVGGLPDQVMQAPIQFRVLRPAAARAHFLAETAQVLDVFGRRHRGSQGREFRFD